MISFGVDIGGSGVKAAPVDLDSGELIGERFRIPTPQPSTPKSVIAAVDAAIDHHSWHGPLGVTIPGVVIDGVVRTAANIDPGWVDFDARRIMSEAFGVPVTVMNDADAAGIAEIRYGAHNTQDGVTLLLTFGTGIGSALFHNNLLLPNSEFGRIEFRGVTAEEYAAGQLVGRDDDDIEWWVERVDQFLQQMDLILSPRLIIFGGGISRRFEEFSEQFKMRAKVVPAKLRNNAGIVGASMAAIAEEYP